MEKQSVAKLFARSVSDKAIKGFTAEFAKGITEVKNAQLRFNSLRSEIFINRNRKRSLSRWVNALGSILNEFKADYPGDSQALNEELLDAEKTLQIDSIVSMLVYLPQSSRDIIEKHIIKIWEQQIENDKKKKEANKYVV